MANRVPAATYRLQLHSDFGFTAARDLVPYLKELGISHLYLSPIFAARSGSRHGYDVIDPTRVNPELGSENDFMSLAAEAKRHGMGLLLDIVPNHMAASLENNWWYDVLEKGRASAYASFFDIDWEGGPDGSLLNKVLLPILDRPLPEALESGELSLALDQQGLFLKYYDHRLPLSATSRAVLMEELQLGELREEELATSADADLKERAAEALSRVNGARLARLIATQNYEPAFWREAAERINYRRFFDINDLVGVRVEDPPVFDATHGLILRLVREGLVDGLRIDHIDGLWDPAGYLHRLAEATGGIYVVVEKILLGAERLRRDWPVAGTSGYDYLATAGGLLVDKEGLEKLSRSYNRLASSDGIGELVQRFKEAGLTDLFPGYVRRLAGRLSDVTDRTEEELSRSLVALTTALPVYRTYLTEGKTQREDRRCIAKAFSEALRHGASNRRGLRAARAVFLSEASNPEERRIAMRWQQLSGAAMAKGLEDSAMYVFNRLVAVNDVGSSPSSIETPSDIETFHSWNRARFRNWPQSINATSTHDTKRSEDVRARISVLSELPDEWNRRAALWRKLNRRHKSRLGRPLAPSLNEEHLIYQVMLGAWPLEAAEEPKFTERLERYIVKAAREAGVDTAWSAVSESYENALTAFVEKICDESESTEFLTNFRVFQNRVAYFGGLNSLSQTLLKIGAPGVPDFYQGNEYCDLSLVDPDNRRPVDFDFRRSQLRAVKATPPIPLLRDKTNGSAKLFLTATALSFRRQHEMLFEKGQYLPLFATGSAREHVVAFARRYRAQWAIIATPRLVAKLTRGSDLMPRHWAREVIQLPPGAPGRWRDSFSKAEIEVTQLNDGMGIRLASLFEAFPVALLERGD